MTKKAACGLPFLLTAVLEIRLLVLI